MQLNIELNELRKYTSNQVNNLFPDKYIVDLNDYKAAFNLCLEKLEYCYNRVSHVRYNNDGIAQFNYLYSDHYLMYIWFLSSTIWKQTNNENLASKLYCLNKALHAFDCMYDTKLPDLFLIFHGAGTMLGKAEYSDYFVALQGCTVGSQKGLYPRIGKGVSLTAHSALIGNCIVGDRVTIAAYTSLFEENILNDKVVFKNRRSGNIEVKDSKECYAKQFFKNFI